MPEEPRERDDDSMRVSLPLVLLADEQDDFRATIAFHLAMAGYPVLETASVAGVVAHSRDAQPDVVILSDGLGNGDVPMLLATLADQPALVDVPVITLSSETGSGRLIECLSHGARDHVRRQDGAEVLVARIDAVLRADEELERLRRRNAELEFLGTVDALTGMANRRAVEEEIDRLEAGAKRHALPLSAVMVRIDECNDTRPGRLRRRETLKRELGYLVAAARRTDDFAGVWDERTFVLLLPMTPAGGARVLAERLRRVVSAAPLNDGTNMVSTTISAAYAQVAGQGVGVLRELEERLVALQQSGGNAVAPVL